MAQYNSFNVKLSNLKLNKLKSAIKNETEVVLRLSPNRSVIMNVIFLINYYELIDKLQIFLNFPLTNHQLVSNYQKLKYIR